MSRAGHASLPPVATVSPSDLSIMCVKSASSVRPVLSLKTKIFPSHSAIRMASYGTPDSQSDMVAGGPDSGLNSTLSHNGAIPLTRNPKGWIAFDAVVRDVSLNVLIFLVC